MSQLRLRLLGGFQTSVEGELITATYTPRLQSLIGYLVLHRDAAHTRQQLAFLIWPDSSESQARTNLRKLLPLLRDPSFALAGCIHEVGQTLQWRTDGSIFVDVIEFERAVVNGAFERAVLVYAGDLLPSCDEEWLATERERLNKLFSDALQQMVAALERRRDYHGAITQAQRLLQLDVLDEAAYSTLMRLHALNGDRASAVRIYLACEQTLKRELGIEPSAETHHLYSQLADLERNEAVRPSVHFGVTRQNSKLVGRIEEWQHLLQVWERTADQPQCAIIVGEAGIGKTRLAQELIEWANRQGILTATARCYAAEGELAYSPITTWLRSDGIRTALEHLDPIWLNEVTRLVPELLTQFPRLPSPGPLTEGWQRQRFFEGLARALLTPRKPRILLLDDLQWSDRETLEWIRYGLHFDAGSRWMIVGTVRIEEVDDAHPLHDFLRTMRQTHAYAEIELGPLSEAETSSLAMRLAGRALAATQLTQLYRETEGNPLFVTETIASNEWLRTLNQVAAEGVPALPASHTPPTILAVINRRLSALSPNALEATRFAAVIGRGFTSQLLVHASGQDEAHIVRALEEMLRKHIVQEHASRTHARGIGDEYDFCHGKIREAAYRGLSTARRRLLHRQVAEVLIAMDSADLDSVSGQIASHYERAGIADLAIQHFVRAALASRQVGANSEAMRWCRRAKDLLDVLPAASALELHSAVLTLQECLGDLLYMSNLLPEAITAFQQAIPMLPAASLSTSSVQHARLLRKIGEAQIMVRQLAEADQTLHRALETLGAVPRYEEGEWRREWLKIQDAWLTFNYWCNRPDDSIEILEQIQPVVERFGTTAEQVSLYRSFTMARIRADRYVVSDELMQMVRILDRLLQASDNVPADPEMLAYNAFTMGFLYLWAGELDVAEPRLLEAAQSAERIGALGIMSPALNYLILVDRLRGDVEKVEAALARCRKIAEQARKPEYVLQVDGNQTWVHWRHGRDDEAVTSGRAALSQYAQLPVDLVAPFMWVTYLPLLDIALRRDVLAEAIEYARSILAPSQMRLLDPVASNLSAALTSWDASRPVATRQNLQDAVEAAKTAHYL